MPRDWVDHCSCFKCGWEITYDMADYDEKDLRFCPQCGACLGDFNENCIDCGEPAEEGQKYCMSCGDCLFQEF